MQNDNVDSHLANAVNFLANKDFVSALNSYQSAIAADENNLEAIKGAGLCCFNLKDNTLGIKYFKQAVNMDRNDATSLYYLASLLILDEKYTDAIEYSKRVIELRPDYFDAYKILFTIYLKLNKYDDILKLNEQFEKQNIETTDDTVHLVVGTVNMMNKNYSAALELFKIAHKISPEKVQTINNIGVCYMSLKQYDEAINAFCKSLDIKNDNTLTYTNLATVYQLKGDFLQALEMFNKALEIEPESFMNLLNVANLSNMLKRYDIAIDAYERMLKINPELKEIRTTLIGAYVKNNQPDKAINLIDKALEKTPKNIPLLFRKAKIYTGIGDYNAAVKIYEHITNFKKNSPAIYHSYGILYTKMDDYDKALSLLNKSLALDDTNAAVHKDVGVIYLMQNQIEYAKEEFDKAMSLGEDDNEILKECADFYYAISDFNKADELYRKSLALESTPETSLSLGRNLIAQNKPEEAFAVLEPLLTKLPENAELLYNIARIYYIQKDYDKAARLSKKAYFIMPTIEIANLMGLSLKELEDYKGAAGIFEKIIEQYPLNEQIYSDLIECLEKLGKEEEVIAAYKKANENLLYSENRTIKYAEMLIKNGKNDEAKKLLEKANFEHQSETLQEMLGKIKG